ncbi:PAQR family membrane homeostasis protein TrhA [Dethiothermospora halolimnae]|uniref:PAQR family membrane homeostasis protein TrhA n=1 Tax=Dethiothermospora halolimnae TaxID=3114390 RepID=UPI003CCBDAA6
MIKRIKEPVNCLTHLFGAILSIVGLVLLVYNAAETATVWHIVTFSIFGASLIALYTASSVYHMLDISKKINRILRKIDHMMIYFLIAGTYTPICLVALRGAWGWTIFTIIWTVAIAGMIIKAVWINVPRIVSTLSYIIMGWIVVIAFFPLVKNLSLAGVTWLILGGVMYTVGGVIYALKKPNITNKYFGFHEIFHIFIILGSICHFIVMFNYILYI